MGVKRFLFFFFFNMGNIIVCLYVNENYLINRENFDDVGEKREICWRDFFE